MSRPSSLRSRLFLITTVLTAGGLSVAACVSEDDPAVGPATLDGSAADTSQTTVDSSPPPPPPPADAGADAPGEEITDGGGLPPEDDAGPDNDAGFDAGPACGPLTAGAYSTSSCASRVSLMAGGALTTTTYVLEKVTVFGSLLFCSNTFVPYDHRGALNVTAASAGAGTFEFVEYYRKSGGGGGLAVRPTFVRYDADVAASGNTLTLTPKACAAKPAPASVGYTVSEAGGKKVLTLRMPYGKGTANYRFVEP